MAGKMIVLSRLKKNPAGAFLQSSLTVLFSTSLQGVCMLYVFDPLLQIQYIIVNCFNV